MNADKVHVLLFLYEPVMRFGIGRRHLCRDRVCGWSAFHKHQRSHMPLTAAAAAEQLILRLHCLEPGERERERGTGTCIVD